MPSLRLAPIVVLALFCCGCVQEQAFVHPEFHQRLPRTVAVMPPINTSNIPAAAQACQFILGDFLAASWRFGVVPIPATVEFLRSKGIYDGARMGRDNGQRWVPATNPSPEVLCQDLGVDGLFVGQINEFKYTELVVVRSRQVKITWMLIDKTGETLWRASGVGVTVQGNESGEDGWENAKDSIAAAAQEEFAGMPLYTETVQATRACLEKLPIPTWGRQPVPRIPRRRMRR